MIGETIGSYRIIGKLGVGGMGEVYRARDTKLDRDVAIKILPESFAHDAERVARFEREGKVLAALNHPNIAQIYGIEDRAIVMELVEGPTLAERIDQGALPLDEALNVAKQIAEALEAAHEKGITHRDLKPANVKLRPDGTVKVLDFGLATPAQGATADGNPSISPTLTLDFAATRAGMIMGTAAYMSPEQASGKPVDKRSDIWSFGVVLWEMLTGKRLFEGETVSHVMADVLKGEIDFEKLPKETPAPIRSLLRRCLDRDVKSRLRDIGEARITLERAAKEPDTAAPASPVAVRRIVPWAVAALFAVVGGEGWMRTAHPAAIKPTDVWFSMLAPTGKILGTVGALSVDRISPDGSMVLFRTNGDSQFYVRRLNSLDSEPLPPFVWFGDPFWSPDSQSIAFPTDNGRLMKMRVPKGSQELITKDMIGPERGGSWGEKGVILFAQFDSSAGGPVLYRVPASGGTPLRVEVPGLKEGDYYNPEFLPGGEDFLFVFIPLDSEGAQIYMATLSGTKAVNTQLLLNNETAAAFTPTGGGRILFVRNDNLYSQALDRKSRKTTGDPELLQERVASYAGSRNAYFSVSHTGTVAWRSGNAVLSQAIVFDRMGNRTGVAGTPVPVNVITLSPDESHLLARGEAGSWIVEANGPGRVNLDLPAHIFRILWSPDSSRLTFVDGKKLVERLLGGSGQLREVAELSLSERMTKRNETSPDGERNLFLEGISADGRRFLFGDGKGLLLLDLDGRRIPERIVGQEADNAAMSPDGRWIVYRPNEESGVYAQPISGTRLPTQIANPGSFPVWRSDGKEILYYDRDQSRICSVRVERVGDQLRFLAPEPLFPVARPLGTNSGSRPLAVNHDGSRIYFLQSKVQPESGVINVRTDAIR